MTGGSLTSTAVIDRMAVRWRAEGFAGVGSAVDGEPGSPLIDPVRLDRLIDLLLAGPLDDALQASAIGRDQIVCLRSVAVAPTTIRWDRSDADVVATWARAVAGAVAASLDQEAADGEVVRYRSVDQAVVDLVVHAVSGDVRRAWAWAQVGLWPAGLATEGVSAGALATVAADLLADQPHQVVAALVVLAESGLLPEALERWGTDRVGALVAAAWAAHGGDTQIVIGTALSSTATHPVSFPVEEWLVRSVIASAFAASLARSIRVGAAPADPDASPDRVGAVDSDVRLARTLAAAVALHVEPAVVSRPSDAVQILGALTERFVVGETLASAAGLPEAAGSDDPAPLIDELAPVVDTVEARPGSVADGRAVVDESGPTQTTPDEVQRDRAPSGTTAWGGLLFLLHVIDDLAAVAGPHDPVGSPDNSRMPVADLAGPSPAWPPSRHVLHRLGLTLASRALPDVDPPRPDDPALLAFAGLAPDADPPEPPPVGESTATAHALADEVLLALRERLSGSTLASAAKPALLAAVLRRSATITADPGWLDVVLDLDQISVPVRRAGLDLDPGWIPWLGVVVRFRYV